MQDKEKQDVGRGSVKQVFHSESYRYLVVLLFLIGLAIAPMNHLKTAILENVGGSVSDLGIDGVISAITQVPFIACADKVEKLSLRVRYLFVTGLPCIACLLAYCAVSPVMIFSGSGLINSGIVIGMFGVKNYVIFYTVSCQLLHCSFFAWDAILSL